VRLFETYVEVFTSQSAGASLCTSNLGFMLKDWATFKEVLEQVARLACSQIYQKGDKPYCKELVFMLYKVNAGYLFEVFLFFPKHLGEYFKA